MKRGEQRCCDCPAPYCSGIKGRCYLCGGEYEECGYGYLNFDACFCGAHAISFWDIKEVEWLKMFRHIFYTIWVTIFRGDFWWIVHRYRWRGK
jgi:hypothetical protein